MYRRGVIFLSSPVDEVDISAHVDEQLGGVNPLAGTRELQRVVFHDVILHADRESGRRQTDTCLALSQDRQTRVWPRVGQTALGL